MVQKNNNYELIIGIDICNKSLITLKNIMKYYLYLRVLMMGKNKESFITTYTMMRIAKYDNLFQ